MSSPANAHDVDMDSNSSPTTPRQNTEGPPTTPRLAIVYPPSGPLVSQTNYAYVHARLRYEYATLKYEYGSYDLELLGFLSNAHWALQASCKPPTSIPYQQRAMVVGGTIAQVLIESWIKNPLLLGPQPTINLHFYFCHLLSTDTVSVRLHTVGNTGLSPHSLDIRFDLVLNDLRSLPPCKFACTPDPPRPVHLPLSTMGIFLYKVPWNELQPFPWAGYDESQRGTMPPLPSDPASGTQ